MQKQIHYEHAETNPLWTCRNKSIMNMQKQIHYEHAETNPLWTCRNKYEHDPIDPHFPKRQKSI